MRANINKKIISHILIVKYRALGDSLIGLGTIAYIKKLYPQVHVTYAIPNWIVPLYTNLQSSADQIIPLSLENLRGWWKTYLLLKRLNRLNRIDLIFEFHQNGRSKYFFNLFSKLHYIRYLFHNHHQSIPAPAIQRDLQGIAALLPIPAPPNYLDYPPRVHIKNITNTNNSNGLLDKKTIKVILGISATRQSKIWPINYFLELAELLSANKQSAHKDQCWEFLIPLSNSDHDQFLEAEIKRNAINRICSLNFVKVGLAELPLIIADCDIYIGNDSGIKHLAVALNIPTFTFFGPEDPEEWHPYNSTQHQYFFVADLVCRTAKLHFCGKDKCEDHKCLKMISVREVYDRICKYDN
ncbi:MAG: glycosyltransferase family 9 protein [Oligoflexia bacterium]|nr:glycosyltransferase family 9 protein [Oligoflexia bacterium]